MNFKVVLSNPSRPENGAVAVSFPIPREEYDSTIERLAGMGIGDVLARDCMVDKVYTDLPVLKRLERENANVDELDYLAKRLDSFSAGETAQFQAAAHAMGLTDVKDLINLTFCCQQVTVINDFHDLESAGKSHILHLRGGGMPVDEYEKVSGETIARALIMTGEGQITPYGVLYDNGMKLEELYQGKAFPPFCHEQGVLTAVLSQDGPSGYRQANLPLPMWRRATAGAISKS